MFHLSKVDWEFVTIFGVVLTCETEMAEPVPRTGSKVPYLAPVTKLEPWFHIFGTMVPQH